MFVTCLYGVLDPASGRAAVRERRPQPADRAPRRRAVGAARHRHAARADARDGLRGEARQRSPPASSVLLYSDGLTEAHDAGPRDVRHPARRASWLTAGRAPEDLIDDLRRPARPVHRRRGRAGGRHHPGRARAHAATPAQLAVLCSSSRCRARRATSARRCERVARGGRCRRASSRARLERLKTAVAEATMNAMEHGNNYDAELRGRDHRDPARTPRSCVRITDHGGGREIPRGRRARTWRRSSRASSRRAAGACS